MHQNSRIKPKKRPTSPPKRSKRKLASSQSRLAGSIRPVIASSPNTGVADKQKVLLRYTTVRQVNSLASTYVGVRWYSNALYDVDPVVGSSSVPFFFEWAQMYSYYRVTGYSIHAEIANLEAFPVTVYLVNMNTDPGTSGISYDQYSTTHGNQFMIGPNSGSSNLKVKSRFSIEQIVGDRIAKTEDHFVGTSASNPIDLTYVGLGFHALANLTNGVYLTVSIQFVAEFFDSKRTAPGFFGTPVSPFLLDAAVTRVRIAKANDKKPSSEDVALIKQHQEFRQQWEQHNKPTQVSAAPPETILKLLD